MTLARGLRGRRAGIELRPAVPLAFQAVQLSLATSRTLASEDRYLRSRLLPVRAHGDGSRWNRC
jgi:hypothetical protein